MTPEQAIEHLRELTGDLDIGPGVAAPYREDYAEQSRKAVSVLTRELERLQREEALWRIEDRRRDNEVERLNRCLALETDRALKAENESFQSMQELVLLRKWIDKMGIFLPKDLQPKENK